MAALRLAVEASCSLDQLLAHVLAQPGFVRPPGASFAEGGGYRVFADLPSDFDLASDPALGVTPTCVLELVDWSHDHEGAAALLLCAAVLRAVGGRGLVTSDTGGVVLRHDGTATRVDPGWIIDDLVAQLEAILGAVTVEPLGVRP